jgi:hypothetical protein
MKREYAFDPDAETGLAYGDGLTHAGMLARDNYALKSLYAFLVAFFDTDVNANRVSGLERRNAIA